MLFLRRRKIKTGIHHIHQTTSICEWISVCIYFSLCCFPISTKFFRNFSSVQLFETSFTRKLSKFSQRIMKKFSRHKLLCVRDRHRALSSLFRFHSQFVFLALLQFSIASSGVGGNTITQYIRIITALYKLLRVHFGMVVMIMHLSLRMHFCGDTK